MAGRMMPPAADNASTAGWRAPSRCGAVRVRGDARQLRIGVVHVEHLVAQNLLEDRPRLRIVIDDLAIDREPAGGRLLRHMQEGEPAIISLVRNGEILETVPTRKGIPPARGPRRLAMPSQQRGAALTKQHPVMQFVDRVLEIQPPQQRIGCDFGGAHDVAPAASFNLGKRQQLPHASIVIAPDPSMNRQHDPVKARRVTARHAATKHVAFRVGVLQPRRDYVRVPLILARNQAVPGTALAPALSMRESDTRLRKRFGHLLELLVQLAISVTGLFLIGCAVGANRQWLDHHILPSFLLPRDWFVAMQNVLRVGMGAAGALLIAHVGPRVGRVVRAAPGFSLSIVVAAMLAIVASEPLLRRMEFRPAGWLSVDDEPRRRADVRLGWSLVPSRAARVRIGGRMIDYVVDANGYRVSRPDAPVERTQPTILFTGESVMFGEGLTWNESITRPGWCPSERADRKPGGPWLRQRSGVSQATGRSSALSTTDCRRVVVHAGVVRKEPRSGAAASGAGPGVAPGSAALACGIAAPADGAVSEQLTDRAGRRADPRHLRWDTDTGAVV